MNFSLCVVIIGAFIATNSHIVSAVECCEPKKIYFTRLPGYNCGDFPNTINLRNRPLFFEYHEKVDAICVTEICKDGQNREHCSIGKCHCKYWFFGCEDTADKCYGDHDTAEDAFAKVWAKKNKGVRGYIKDDNLITVWNVV